MHVQEVFMTVQATTGAADLRRRKILRAATAGAGGIGAVATIVPFVETLAPSEAVKAAGAPVEVDISRIGSGKLIIPPYTYSYLSDTAS
jgi:ubiquinol-cytochrome c reductase iron-sulfur subunit